MGAGESSGLMETRFFATPAEFRSWLMENHASATELGVVLHSIARRLDETARVQRFTPRKPKSNWSAVNIKKVEELTAKELMMPAGVAAFARREEARSGVYSYENRHLAALDPEREAKFRAESGAWEFFSRQPPSYRQTAIYRVMNAKREETRTSRLARLIEESAQGRRLV